MIFIVMRYLNVELKAKDREKPSIEVRLPSVSTYQRTPLDVGNISCLFPTRERFCHGLHEWFRSVYDTGGIIG